MDKPVENPVDNPQAPHSTSGCSRKEQDSDRLALASSASWANIIDDSRVSADRVSVYRMVDRTISNACFLHEPDDRFEGLRVLSGIAVQLYIADVASLPYFSLSILTNLPESPSAGVASRVKLRPVSALFLSQNSLMCLMTSNACSLTFSSSP